MQEFSDRSQDVNKRHTCLVLLCHLPLCSHEQSFFLFSCHLPFLLCPQGFRYLFCLSEFWGQGILNIHQSIILCSLDQKQQINYYQDHCKLREYKIFRSHSTVSFDMSLVPWTSAFVLKNMRTSKINRNSKEGRVYSDPIRSTFLVHLPHFRFLN